METSMLPDLQSFVEQEFATGMHGSREEVILQAVTWLREERSQALSGIKEGLEDVSGPTSQTSSCPEVFRSRVTIRPSQALMQPITIRCIQDYGWDSVI